MGGVLCGAHSHRVIQALDGLGGFQKGLTDANKAKFADYFKLVTVKEGTPLYKEGQPAKEAYVVIKGEVKISWCSKLLCRCIEADVFGEEALVKCDFDKDVERITSATAANDVVVLVLTKRAFQRIQDNDAARKLWEHFKANVLDSHNLVKYCMLRRVPFLSTITGPAFVELSALFEYVYFGRKTLVWEENTQGDTFYLLCRGSAVITTSKHNVEVVLSNLNAGSYIGEIALVNKIPRTANFKTLTTCLCLKLVEPDFAQFVAKSPAIKDQLLDLVKNRTARTLKSCNIPFFATLSESTFQLIAEVARVMTFNVNEMVFRAGDPGDNFYIICEGAVGLLDATDGVEFKRLGKGDYFGELALLTDRPRSASVRAKEPCLLLAISKEEFRSIFSDERPALAEIEIKVLRDDVELYSVLNHPRAREAFTEHQKLEFNVDNIEYWQAAEHFYRTYSNGTDKEDIIPPDKMLDGLAEQYTVIDDAAVVKLVNEIIKCGRANTVWAARELVSRWERRNHALRLYHLFIEEGAEKQQNISDGMRRKVTKRVVKNELPPDLFREAQNQVYMIMQEPFHRFKKTDMFQALLNEVGTYKKSSVWKAKLKLDSSGRKGNATASVLLQYARQQKTLQAFTAPTSPAAAADGAK